MDEVLDGYDDILEPLEESDVLDEVEDFVNGDQDTQEASIFNTDEMPDELRSEIEAIEGETNAYELPSTADEDLDDPNADIIDPASTAEPAEFSQIADVLHTDTTEITDDTILDSTANLNAAMTPREDLLAQQPGSESDEVEEEYPKEEVEMEEIKDDEILETTDEVADVADEVGEVEAETEAPVEEVEGGDAPVEDVEEEYTGDTADINTEAEQAILVEIQDAFAIDPENVEEAQSAISEQIAEDAVDAESEAERDAFANVSEMADVNIAGSEDEEPHYVHEGEEVRPGVVSEATESNHVDLHKFVDIAFKSR